MDRFLKVAVLSRVAGLFDYLPAGQEPLFPGMRLEVPFGSTKRVGILWAVSDRTEVTSEKLKPILRPLDPEPILSPLDRKLLAWTARYYHAPLGEVVVLALPPKLRQPIPLPDLSEAVSLPELPPAPSRSSGFQLNPDQSRAVETLLSHLDRFFPLLLEGVTGSGKTEVYLEAICEVVRRGRQALVLLPEIALTPQIEARFQERLGEIVAIYHSGLSAKQRLETWLRFQRGELPVLVGTRSATFMPMKRAGLIVVDEEHDPAYKQQDGVRFSARDVAVRRAQLLKIPVILGSATPSFESLYNSKRQRYHHILLSKRAKGASLPTFHTLDLRSRKLEGGFLPETLSKIEERLRQNEQVIIFHNRRGYAPVLTCEACGWVASCRHCSTRLVYHKKRNRLRCHHCGSEWPVPPHCPACRAKKLQPLGRGTERIESFLRKRFPAACLGRLDRDTACSRQRLLEIIEKMQRREIDLLIGTQMLSKGHHFPGVTLVVIPNADAGLLSWDFRAPERLAQTVVQVAGRAGRGEKPGEVLLQTRHPDHPLLRALLEEGYRAFVEMALEERKAAQLPPFSHQALVVAEAKEEEVPEAFLEAACDVVAGWEGLLVLGPAPAPIQKRAGFYRYQLLLQSEARLPLHRALDALLEWQQSRPKRAGLRLFVDVDPLDLL